MTKIINAEQLMDELEDLYNRAGWEDDEIHFSLRDMRANINGMGPATFRGYNISELSFAAGLLIGQGIRPQDLTDLIDNFARAVEMIQKITVEGVAKALREVTGEVVVGDG